MCHDENEAVGVYSKHLFSILYHFKVLTKDR